VPVRRSSTGQSWLWSAEQDEPCARCPETIEVPNRRGDVDTMWMPCLGFPVLLRLCGVVRASSRDARSTPGSAKARSR
jgi:hypothetical protein